MPGGFGKNPTDAGGASGYSELLQVRSTEVRLLVALLQYLLVSGG